MRCAGSRIYPSTREAEADPSLSSSKANLVYSFRTGSRATQRIPVKKKKKEENEEEREKRKFLGTYKLKISLNVYQIETKFLFYHS